MEKNFEFEPFQQVLVWDSDYRLWRADFFSHNDVDSEYPFCCVRDDWRKCIPYTQETAHLLGTAQPYEPPVDEATRFTLKEDVEVSFCGGWVDAVYLAYHGGEADPHVVFESGKVNRFTPSGIRKKAGV